MLDVVFVALTIVSFAVVALVAKGVEKLGADPRRSAPRDIQGGNKP